MHFPLTLLLTGWLAGSSVTTETDQVFKADMLPAKAARPMAFVPAGWLLERQVAGDLNADKRPDQVLLLVERPSDAPDAKRERAVVVLLAEPAGFRRVGAAGAVVPCVGCAETSVGADGVPEMAISKGQLSIRHIAGNAQTVDMALFFRYEPTASRVRLVAQHHVKSNRKGIDTTVRHSDFLTGQQVTERIYADPNDKGGTRQLTSRKEAKVPTTPRFLEDLKLGEISL